MSGPDDPKLNMARLLIEPDHREPASVTDPVSPDDDRFAAVFAAARGTVSPDLDLNGILDEPVVTGEYADVGHRRSGS
jgi:hypothetical protein